MPKSVRLLLPVLLLLPNQPVRAQGPALGLTLGASLILASNKAHDLVEQAREAGNDLLLGTGVEIENAISSAQIAYEAELTKTMAQVGDAERKAVTDINNVIDTAETKGAKAAHDLLEQTQLIANTIPFSNKIPQLAGYSPHFVTPTSGTIHVDISGNFPFPFTDVFKPSLKIGGQSFDATSYGTNAIEFEFPTNVCGAAQTNTAVRSCSGTVSIPWDSTHGLHLRRSVSQGVFRVEFGLLPSNAGSFTITHKVESTRHDEVGKSSDVFTYDSSNNDIEENRPLHLTDQEIKDGWRIKPGSAHFVLVEHIEGVQGHDWYDMGYQNGNDVQVVWRARTERKHVGSSGKIRWRIDCTMMRNVPVTTDAKDILTANWSTSQVFEYPIGTWKLTWNTFDGKTLEYIDTDLSNVFMQLSARGTAFVVSTYKQQ